MIKNIAQKYISQLDGSIGYKPSSLEQEIIVTRYNALHPRYNVSFIFIMRSDIIGLPVILLKDAVKTYAMIESRKEMYTEEEYNELLKSSGVAKVKYLLDQNK